MSGSEDFGGSKVLLFLGTDLLALRRDHSPGIPWPGYLDFPGGARDPGEDPKTVAIRETLEEVGIALTPDQLAPVVFHKIGRGTWFFAAHLEADTKVVFGGEGAGWQRMPPQDFVSAQDAVPVFREVLRAYLAAKDSAG